MLSNQNYPATQQTGDRPDCMEFLELLPPYTAEDVNKAYKALSLKYHPDRGGSTEQFMKLQKAHDQAQEYVRFRKGRREWMANLVEPYTRQQEVVEEVHKRHGEVKLEQIDWMQHSFGDFATLTERLRSIDLSDSTDVDDFIEFLAGRRENIGYLEELDLSGSTLTDAGLAKLARFEALKRLNIARTKVTTAGLEKIARLSGLQQLDVSGLGIGWWAKRKVRKNFPNVEVVF